jgi:hypothetical protein
VLNLYDLEQLAAQRQEAIEREARLLHLTALPPQPSVRERVALRLVAVALRLAPSLRDQVSAPARVSGVAGS